MPTYPAHVTKQLAFDVVILKGHKGLKVQRVQEWLSLQDCPTPIDGDFGDATEKCVKDFQQSNGMSATGAVNKGTWGALTEPLHNALSPIELPAGSSIAEAMLRVAKQHLAQHPAEIGGENRGPWVRIYMGGNQGKEWPWCAGFISFVMKQACMVLERSIPIPGSLLV